jgi:hypothetical protein
MAENVDRSDLIRRIVEGALGELAHWQRPAPLPSIGPAFPEVFDRFERQLSQLRTAVEEQLALWSLPELRQISPESEAPKLNPLFDEQGRLGQLAITLRSLKSQVPQDFVGGWSVAGKEVDLQYWVASATISLDDLVFLSLGREPRQASLRAVCDTYGRSDEADKLLYFLEDRLELIANAMGCDPADSKAMIGLKAFFDWVQEVRFPIDPGFHLALRRRFDPETGPSHAEGIQPLQSGGAEGGKFDPRERASLVKLITAMAVDGYGYDPNARRSPIPREIEDVALRLGIEITTETIRKFLREGSQYLPKEGNRTKDYSLKE